MRNNQPVIAEEYPLQPGTSLVSTTDLKGRILHCNQAFIEVSGFPLDELLGQPHNLVRHPDMPPEAFRDMWDTIAKGLPWTGLVKNRRKDGRYYWVRANVTPLMDNQKPVGYLSVRSTPDRSAVADAERLYEQMRAEAASGRQVITLHRGEVHINTLVGRLQRALRWTETAQSALACSGLGAVAAAGAAAVSAATTGVTVASLGSVAAGAVLGAVYGAWTGRRRQTQWQELVVIANRMAACDLTQNVEGQQRGTLGAMRQALSQLNVNLRSVVSDARAEVQSLRLAATAIAQGNADLASRTESQAANLEQTAASIEQITGTVSQSAEAATKAATLASEAHHVTQQGSQAMEAVTATMQVIDRSSQRINEIISVIDSIAFQTNILALNAAVEAARAGEQGRGFAVVASEVRSLAQRTTGAAREIKSLIGDSSEKVQAGNNQTQAAQHTIAGALATAREVSLVIEGISNGAREQLTGISQINAAVAQLDTITQRNAALVEELSGTSQRVEEQALAVEKAVQVFALHRGASNTLPDAVELRRSRRRETEAQS
jgi:aerotaxis receptor